MTIQTVQQNFTAQLANMYSQSEAGYITKLVLEKVLEIDRNKIKKFDGYIISPIQEQQLTNCLHQLLQNTPLQYVLGQTWFYNCLLYLNKHVLIPRPETEELVEWILHENKLLTNDSNFCIIDIGTGSGCIPIALKKHIPISSITAIDISKQALQVAEKNAINNQQAITFLQANFLLNTEWEQFTRYDIIVSNPPYIPVIEKEIMAKTVVDFEPPLALFVPDNNPQLFYEKIAAFGKLHLKKEGKIYVEVHENFAAQTEELFKECYKTVILKKDISGKQRMIMATQYRLL